MRKIGKLRHAAAGLLGSFVSRNNDLWGHWALGPLYARAHGAGGMVELRLLDAGAFPGAQECITVARRYAIFLRRTLAALGLRRDELHRADIVLAFDIVPGADLVRLAPGNPFLCTVTLALRDGRSASCRAYGHCLPQPPFIFTRRRGSPA
jgi:hypothetical protein